MLDLFASFPYEIVINSYTSEEDESEEVSEDSDTDDDNPKKRKHKGKKLDMKKQDKTVSDKITRI